MSLSDKKRNIFTTISSYTSFMQQSDALKATDLFSSVSNKDEIIPYLLDVLKTIAGTDGLKETVGGLFTKVIADSEIKIKESLKKQVIQSNSGNEISNDFKINGINAPLNKIDTKGKFKIDPCTTEGSLIYKKSGSEDFDSIVYKAIKNPNTSFSIDNMNINITYNDVTDEINIKPPADINLNVGDYLSNYIDNAQIVNENEIMTNVMDSFYGTFSKKTNRTRQQILDDLKVQKLLEKVINNEESLVILPNENEEMETLADQLSNGVVIYKLGCGILSTSLPFSGLTALISTTSGNTDAFAVANAIEVAFDLSNKDVSQTAFENKEAMRDSFFQKLIKIFANALSQFATTQPQIRVLISIYELLFNQAQPTIDTANVFIENMKIFIKCLVKEVLIMIAEFIFNLAVAFLIKLLAPVVKKVIKEKTNQYTKALLSLVGLASISDLITTG